jgi:hypothetical protein
VRGGGIEERGESIQVLEGRRWYRGEGRGYTAVRGEKVV